MVRSMLGAMAMAAALVSAPAMATTFITDPISNPSSQWNGIDYWGVQVSQFSKIDQTLTFDIASDSKIDLFIQGSPKFQFTDLLLNGQSIAGNFTVGNSLNLTATGYSAAGPATLRFVGDYTCANCWGDWFGGYVQATKAALPGVPALPDPSHSAAVPEPATWAMTIAGIGLIGGAMRRRRAKTSFA
nr:PEPxxWA-CTERM sorting domain-containing protein [Novosphingobium sp. G106]